jgi:hypothetical protein
LITVVVAVIVLAGWVAHQTLDDLRHIRRDIARRRS